MHAAVKYQTVESTKEMFWNLFHYLEPFSQSRTIKSGDSMEKGKDFVRDNFWRKL